MWPSSAMSTVGIFSLQLDIVLASKIFCIGSGFALKCTKPNLWNSPGFKPSATTTLQPSPKPKEVVHKNEIHHYHELGLGRGVNVTDPDMWKNKTPYLVRRACENLENIIGTQECEILESYKKEVSTFETQQQKLCYSLNNASSQVKIGMDEQSSRSANSTKLIEGKKIDTRTISFQFHFDDIPLYDDVDQAVIEAPKSFLQESDKNKFEEDLAHWFLKRIGDCKTKASGSGTDQDSSVRDLEVDLKSGIQRLADKINQLLEDAKDEQSQRKWIQNIQNDCKTFLNHLGITHYVSAITLGACEYHIAASRSEKKRLGVSTSKSAGSLAKGGLSGFIEKQFSVMGEEKQNIGRMDSVKEEVTKEAVVGFEIQPLYKLVRIQLIQVILRKLIKEYIQSKNNSKLFCLFFLLPYMYKLLTRCLGIMEAIIPRQPVNN